jgi:hypothetical protein
MSDLLTHWAVFDDCRRLVRRDPAIEPLFVRLIHEEREYARLGSISRGGGRWVPAILEHARSQWADTQDVTFLGRKLAFALGGIAHFPADFVMKPLMSKLAKADWDATHHAMQGRIGAESAPEKKVLIREISAYYDVHVFREVYLAGQEEPFTRFLVAENTTAPGQALEAFIQALFQRALLSSHTLAPDMDNIDAWLDQLFARVQPLYVDIGMYTRVFTNPDPEKIERFQVTTAFYRADDPIIQIARALQRGAAIDDSAFDAALVPDTNSSGYGRALEIGMRCFREASAYWRGEREEPPDVRQG